MRTDNTDKSKTPTDPAVDLWVVDLGAWRVPGPAPEGALRLFDPSEMSQEAIRAFGMGGALAALTAMDFLKVDSLALCVGHAVRAGQATASRASLIGRSPLTGHLTQGQVGSDLANRLARIGHGLLLVGNVRWAEDPSSAIPNSGAMANGDAVLRVDTAGGFHLEHMAALADMDTRARAERILADFGPGSVLRPGPAAHAGTRFANLSAGMQPPSFVGRGGLGFAFASFGLGGLLVQCAPVEQAAEQEAWQHALLHSPRLLARAQGQRLQEAPNPGSPSVASAEGSDSERHGCKGCPTPCGFVLSRAGQEPLNARFSAFEPLLRCLPDVSQATTQDLLLACNQLGIDALEAGTCLAQVISQSVDRKEPWSNPVERLRGLALGLEEPREFQLGAKALAEKIGGIDPSQLAQGEGVRPAEHALARLAQSIGMRGAEPLRSFPFLVGDQVDLQRVAQVVDPLHLPLRVQTQSKEQKQSTGQEQPTGPWSMESLARLLWWHENLVAGVDALGICAFSVGGLLSDGVLDQQELAQAILPKAWPTEPGQDSAEALLSIGALAIGWFGRVDGAPQAMEVPKEWGPAWLEYQMLRRGSSLGDMRLGRIPEGLQRPVAPDHSPVPDGNPKPDTGQQVRLKIQPEGVLTKRLPAEILQEWSWHPTWLEVLKRLADSYPQARPWLLIEGRPVPAGLVQEKVLTASDRLQDGQAIRVLLAISGG